MADALLRLDAIRKAFGAHQVLNGIDLELRAGEIVGLLGPNGSGKSTLLNAATGFVPHDAGEVHFNGRDMTNAPGHIRAAAGLVRTFQLPSMPTRMTVREVIQAGAHPGRGLGALLGRWTFDDEVDRFIDQFLLRPVADHLASALSGGQKKLLSIATALRSRPKLLCLDEPTAGVHPELRRQIVGILKEWNALGLTILVVEHDMGFIRDLCNRCVVLDRGSLIADCAPKDLVENERVVEAYLGKAAQRRRRHA